MIGKAEAAGSKHMSAVEQAPLGLPSPRTAHGTIHCFTLQQKLGGRQMGELRKSYFFSLNLCSSSMHLLTK